MLSYTGNRLRQLKNVIVILLCFLFLAVVAIRKMSVYDIRREPIESFPQHRQIENIEEKRDRPKSLLHLFTTWIPEAGKSVVHNNVLHMWTASAPAIKPIVFSDHEEISLAALENGWYNMDITRSRCGGVPVMRTMFASVQEKYDSVFYGYANSDIIFTSKLEKTLSALSQLDLIKQKPVLLIGRRTNVDIGNSVLLSHSDVENLAKEKGELFIPVAMDYFITNTLFPWQRIPEMVVGRGSVDNFLVCMARKLNITVIDVTGTVLALHQTTSDGNYAGIKRQHTKCNALLMVKVKMEAIYEGNMERGQTECASHVTVYDSDHTISLRRRTLPKICFTGIENDYVI